MGFLKTLLIIVAIWYFFKLAFRFFGPILIRTAIKKAGQNFQKQAQGFNKQNTEDFNSTYTNNQKQPKNFDDFREKKKVGEYIEFEEIK